MSYLDRYRILTAKYPHHPWYTRVRHAWTLRDKVDWELLSFWTPGELRDLRDLLP